MTWDLNAFRLITASPYPGLMGALADHPSCVGILSGDAAACAAPNISLEGLDGVRRRWRPGDLTRLADFVPKLLLEKETDPRPVLFIPQRFSGAWRDATVAWPSQIRLLGSPPALLDPIAENKIHVREQLRRLGIPVPPSLALAREEIDFRAVASALGVPFVTQTPKGSGGQGTYLIRDAAGLDAALAQRPHFSHWLLSGYAGEVTLCLTGVIHEDGLHTLPTSVQLMDIPELGSAFGGFCGNDFGAVSAVSPIAMKTAYTNLDRLGSWLHELGHRGLFGVDVAVSGDEIAFLEINPRVLGSSPLMDSLQRRLGRTSCLIQHAQALLGQPRPPDIEGSLTGSHLLLRWNGPSGVVKAVPSYPGVTGLPRLGTVITPGAIAARVVSPVSLTAGDGRSLLPHGAALVALLRSAFDIRPLG